MIPNATHVHYMTPYVYILQEKIIGSQIFAYSSFKSSLEVTLNRVGNVLVGLMSMLQFLAH